MREGNNDGREYMVRGLGYAKSTADLHVVLATSPSGVPVTVRDIGNVALGRARWSRASS